MNETHWEAVLEARYGIHYNAANERLYRRLRFFFDAAALITGSSAFAAWVANSPGLAGGAGLAVAIISAVNQLVSPAEMAAKFNEAYRAFTALDARTKGMTDEAIKAEIAGIRANSPWGVDSLGPPAYNRCLTANGYSDGFLPVSRWQRFVAFFA